MACIALTAGYPQDCIDSMGGVQEVFVIEHANIDSVTVTANVVTSIDKATSKRFWEIAVVKQAVGVTDTPNVNVQNGSAFFEQGINLVFNKIQTNVIQLVRALVQNGAMVVFKDMNGKKWMLGRTRGLNVTGGEGGTGTAPGDRNGYALNLTGQEPEPMIEVDDATYAALETPGS